MTSFSFKSGVPSFFSSLLLKNPEKPYFGLLPLWFFHLQICYEINHIVSIPYCKLPIIILWIVASVLPVAWKSGVRSARCQCRVKGERTWPGLTLSPGWEPGVVECWACELCFSHLFFLSLSWLSSVTSKGAQWILFGKFDSRFNPSSGSFTLS